ncbi:MAG: DUF3833 domain-containing protein [Pseudomonadota bacterium]
MRIYRSLMAIALLALVTACSSVSVEDYAGNEPRFVPETFFDGQLVAHGVVKDRGGKVIRRFRADIKAYWKDGVGTLDEDFVFDDGEVDKRIWTLTPQADGSYVGTAGDVVGDGVLTVAGNSMFLDYVLRVPWRDGSIDLRIDDRMYLLDENTLLNESSMTKFGLEVGQLLLVIQRLP